MTVDGPRQAEKQGADTSLPVRLLHRGRVLSAYVGAALTMAIMVAVVADVVARALNGRSIAGLADASTILLVGAVYLPMAYAESQGANVATNIVTSRLPDSTRRHVELVTRCAAFLFVAWVAWHTMDRGLASMQEGEFLFGLRRLPVWPARLLVGFGFVTLAIELTSSIASRVKQPRSFEDSTQGSAADVVSETEIPL